jgi:ElaB/YqjD/DUF883 family membrane-anchored ribosome-binding protein
MAGMSGKSGNAKDRIEEAATNVGHRAQEAATAAGHRIQETAGTLAHRAQEAGSTMAQKASEVASTAERRTDETLSNVGQGMSSLAGQLRQNAPEGMLGSAAGAVADRLQASGRYLQEHGLGDMADDMSGVVRRYPLPALCIGFGVGFLLGMALTRR